MQAIFRRFQYISADGKESIVDSLMFNDSHFLTLTRLTLIGHSETVDALRGWERWNHPSREDQIEVALSGEALYESVGYHLVAHRAWSHLDPVEEDKIESGQEPYALFKEIAAFLTLLDPPEENT